MKPPMDYETGGSSRVGDRRDNQDRYLCARAGDTLLLCLADGMGGHPRGEVAAGITVATGRRLLAHAAKPIPDPARFLQRLLLESHIAIRRFGEQQDPPINPRTTAVAALIQNGTAWWVHAGDSRLYLFRNGTLLTRTKDHSYVEQLRRNGVISPRQQQHHPQRNFVTRCLGGGNGIPQIEQGNSRLQIGDQLLLCSDGLWSSIAQEVIPVLLGAGLPLTRALDLLTEEAAQAAYPESDNVTAVAIRVNSPCVTEKATRSGPAPASPRPVDLQAAVTELQNAIARFEANRKEELP